MPNPLFIVDVTKNVDTEVPEKKEIDMNSPTLHKAEDVLIYLTVNTPNKSVMS